MATKRIARKRFSRTSARKTFRPHPCRKLRPRAEPKFQKIASLRVERRGAFAFQKRRRHALSMRATTRDRLITCSAVKKRFFIGHFVGVIFAARKISHGSESC